MVATDHAEFKLPEQHQQALFDPIVMSIARRWISILPCKPLGWRTKCKSLSEKAIQARRWWVTVVAVMVFRDN